MTEQDRERRRQEISKTWSKQIREAERQIAEAKPTLSAAEKQRRLDELKAAGLPV